MSYPFIYVERLVRNGERFLNFSQIQADESLQFVFHQYLRFQIIADLV